MTFIYREHALQRMFERDIFEQDVEDVILRGEIIEEYLDDKLYPSFLALGFFQKPLHVVYAINKEEDQMIIITAYYPDKAKWGDDYKKRITV